MHFTRRLLVRIDKLSFAVSRLAFAVFVLLTAAGCNLPGQPQAQPPVASVEVLPIPTIPAGQPTSTLIQPLAETPTPIIPGQVPTDDISLPPTVEAAPPTEAAPTEVPATEAAESSPAFTPRPESAGPQLAFLKDKDIWLLDEPAGEPYQLSVAGDILSFTWSPDGERLAAFNGQTLCFVHRDGSVRSACLDLGIEESLASIERRIVWSPMQDWIVLWNPVNPWDEASIGWLIVALDGSGNTYRIQDPVDWGASLAPNNEAGGITGQPLFLPDGALIGTLTHRILCSSGGCHYQLFQLDLQNRSFSAYPNKPEEGWSEGQQISLSKDGNILANAGVFFFGCDSYISFVDTYEIAGQARSTYNLENKAVAELALSPDPSQIVFSHTAGCANEDAASWSQACGLSAGFEIYPMQYWNLADNTFRNLPAGIMPAWSPDAAWVAFRSCLASDASGAWVPGESVAASIYLLNPVTGEIKLVSPGSYPAWRPQ